MKMIVNFSPLSAAWFCGEWKATLGFGW